MNVKNTDQTDQSGTKKPIGRPTQIRARDILATDFVEAPVICVNPEKTVREIAQLLSSKKISAVPIIDEGKIVGIVSERDLLQRHELGTETRLMGQGEYDVDSTKLRGIHACDVMSCTIVTVSEDTSLAEIVEKMLTMQIRRVLVTRDAKLIGVVSRSDVVRVLAARPEGAGEPMSDDDDIIRFKVIETLIGISGSTPWLTTVNVVDGIVELTGSVHDETAMEPSRIAIENISNVVGVDDKRVTLQPYGG